MTSPFEHIKSINEDHTDPVDAGDRTLDGYSQFLTARALSLHRDTVMFAQESNKMHELPALWHYRFLFHLVNKKRRWSKWPKQKKPEGEALEAIQSLYRLSPRKAEEAASLLTAQQKKEIVARLYQGGSK